MANPILNLGNNEWATKRESLLGYSKSGSNFKSVPFTHSRASIGTTIDRNGVLQTEAVNIPRIDFKDNIKGSLLLEPQRTNYIKYSQNISESIWNKKNVNYSSNFIDPSGNNNAFKIYPDTVNTEHYLEQTLSTTTATTYTASAFVKDGGTSNFEIIIVHVGVGISVSRALFTITDGIISFSSSTGIVENVEVKDFGNGWYRCEVKYSWTGTVSSHRLRILPRENAVYVGDNINGVYVYGMQVEQADYPTSYIQTGASTVTRLKDECKNGGNADLFNDSEGVVFVDLQGLADVDATNRYITLSDGTATNSIMIQYRNSGDLRLYNGGTGSANLILSIAADLTERKKIAIQYGTTANNYKVYINGASQTISGSFSATSMSGLDRFRFDYVVDTLEFFGKVHQAMVFNEALSDSELQTLTTL